MSRVEFNLGEKIRRFRIERNLTLKDIAESTGFSKSLISRIEHNLISPPIGTLYMISQALNVRMKEFFDEEPVSENLRIVRAEERQRIYRNGSRYGYRYESLAHGDGLEGAEPLLVTLSPENKGKAHFFNHSGYEFILVLKGRMHFYYGKMRYLLKAGDSVYFNARVHHRGSCAGRGEVSALSIRYTDSPRGTGQ
jgi:transcriptional regulator with XRE-family HTH domain